MNMGRCELCPRHKYSNKSHNIKCLDCPNLKGYSKEGATSVANCTEGKNGYLTRGERREGRGERGEGRGERGEGRGERGEGRGERGEGSMRCIDTLHISRCEVDPRWKLWRNFAGRWHI